MNKKLGVVILLILLVMPIVLAKETTINVKTLPNHDIILKTLDPYPGEGESNLLEAFKNNTGESGTVSFISHNSKGVINIIVIIEKDGNRPVINEKTLHKFEQKTTGGTINLEIEEKPAVVEPVVNDTAEPELNKTEEVVEESEPVEEVVEEIEEKKEGGKIMGAIVGGGKAIVTSKITYYIIGGVFVVCILFFIIRVVKKKLKSKKGKYLDFKIKPFNEFKSDDVDRKILDAEKKLKEAEQELEEITSRKKQLKEAKEKFERDKEELDKLERD